MNKRISGIILAYNEEENIKKAINSLDFALKQHFPTYEIIIVVYEGTTDKTESIVMDLIPKYKNLRLVIQKKRDKGYGAGLRLGFKSAKYEYIFYTDGDNQFDVGEINRLLPYLDEYDIVSGYRRRRKDYFMRIVYARVYNILIGILFLKWFKDVDSAFKIYKKRIFSDIKIYKNSGMAIAESIIKAMRKGYKIKEIPVSHFYRHKGKARFEYNIGIIKFGVVWALVKDMFSLWKEIYLKGK